MRRSHFDALQPICPRCRRDQQLAVSVALTTVLDEDDHGIIQGMLQCTANTCSQEYPILDGIPLLVPNVRSYLADNLPYITTRDDLTEPIESILGDAAGPGTWFDSSRQHLSTYAWDNYADLDPDDPAADVEPGSVIRCLERGIQLMGSAVEPPVLDVGCGAGRTAFELAARTDGLVLGVDLNVSLLRLAHRIARTGVVRYPRRRVGLVYDRREFHARFDGAERVDFWACDAMALPFSSARFATLVGMNVLDSVASPIAFLGSVQDVLSSGGHAILSTPYDWSSAVTPAEAWIGGHSQRSAHKGASESLLRALLTPGAHPQSFSHLTLAAEADVPWHTRLHDRSTVSYRSHLVVVRATKDPGR